MKLYRKFGLAIASMILTVNAHAGPVYLKLEDADVAHPFTVAHRDCIKGVTVTASTMVPDEALGLAAADNAISRKLTLSYADMQHLIPGTLYKMAAIPDAVSPLHTLRFSGRAEYPDNEFDALEWRSGMGGAISHAEINAAMDAFLGLCIKIKPDVPGMAMARLHVDGTLEQIDAATAAGAVDLPAAIVAAWEA